MPESIIEVLHGRSSTKKLTTILKSYKQFIMEINKQIDAAEEARQKEYKRIKDAMKADIKQQSAEQVEMNKERKTSTGTAQSMAQQSAHLNRVDLRHLFIAYAIHRLSGGRFRNIPEQDYTFIANTGKIIRKDGKAITNAENAPSMELVTKILEKYGTGIKQSKTVHLSS